MKHNERWHSAVEAASVQGQTEPIPAAVRSVRNASVDAVAAPAELVPMCAEVNVESTKANPLTTHAVILVNSGEAMRGLESKALARVDSILAELEEHDCEACVSVMFFSEEVTMLTGRVPAAMARFLMPKNYRIRGCGVVLDALGVAICRFAEDAKCANERVRMIVITNDVEPASCVFPYEEVCRLVGEKRSEGWEFSLVVVS